MSKTGFCIKKMSKELSMAEYLLRSAIIRGKPEEEINQLRAERDALQNTKR